MTEQAQIEQPSSCVSTSNLPTTESKHQRYNRSDKGKAREALRNAKRKARRRLDKNARNRNRYIDNFGQRCGTPTRSAGVTVVTKKTGPCTLCPSVERLAARTRMVELCPACGRNVGMPEEPRQISVRHVSDIPTWEDEPLFYINAYLVGRFPRVMGGPAHGEVPHVSYFQNQKVLQQSSALATLRSKQPALPRTVVSFRTMLEVLAYPEVIA